MLFLRRRPAERPDGAGLGYAKRAALPLWTKGPSQNARGRQALPAAWSRISCCGGAACVMFGRELSDLQQALVFSSLAGMRNARVAKPRACVEAGVAR